MSEQQWPVLRDEEWEISATEFEGDERAWRNVHPNHRIGETLTSQIYDPSIKDKGRRSTARESAIEADAHFEEYRKSGRSSDGVCAVPLSLIRQEGLRWIDDSYYETELTGHASIDFQVPDLSLRDARQTKKVARRLARAAKWVHPARGRGEDVTGKGG